MGFPEPKATMSNGTSMREVERLRLSTERFNDQTEPYDVLRTLGTESMLSRKRVQLMVNMLIEEETI